MRTSLPSDCGNSPRTTLVSEVVTHWARREVEALASFLAADVEWTLVGRTVASGAVAAERACPAVVPDALEVTSIITHGRLASCDGHLVSGAGRTAFSHVLRFASTARTAPVKEIRTYLVDVTS